ncbi:MAG: class I SAM-dependent methyltransferase [Pseudomonadota bacterium]
MADDIRTEDGVPIGNHYDKYASGNPIARALMRGFEEQVLELVRQTGARDIHEVGCGEGHLARMIASTAPERFRASDFSGDIVATARDNCTDLDIEFLQRDIYELQEKDGAELMICCEVLEHLERPEAALEILSRIARRHVVFSVPREPLWRALNMARGKYWGALGNTPGHLQHWSSRRFVAFIGSAFDIVAVRKPLPWTMVLARVRDRQ